MRKLILGFVVFIFLVVNSSIMYAGSTIGPMVNKDFIKEGLVKVKYDSQGDKRIKLMIKKGQDRYYYNIKRNEDYESFPLQLGEGNYELSLLENIDGNKYKYIHTENVNFDSDNENIVYLTSVQNVKWAENMEAIKLAKDLTKDLETNDEKINAIYDYIIKNIRYDYDKIKTLTTDYIPDIDSTVAANKGICYDYSSLLASMLRSIGIPTKLVMGYTENVEGYHAWNEIYLEDTREWIVVDTTYDATARLYNMEYELAKDRSQYNISKIY